MFIVVNSWFGCRIKPHSVFSPINIDFGWVAKLNSQFIRVNTDFGCHGLAIGRRAASASIKRGPIS